MADMYTQTELRLADVCIIPVTTNGVSWAIPLVSADIIGKTGLRFLVDMSGAQEWRLTGNLSAAAAAGAKVRLRYATTAGGSLSDMGTTGDLSADAAGNIVGLWTSVPAGARGPSYLAVRGVGGDGATTAVVEYLTIQFR